MLAQPAAAQEAQPLPSAAAAGLEHEIAVDRQFGDDTLAQAVLRDSADAGGDRGGRRRPLGQGLPPRRTSPCARRHQTGEQAGQRPLAVARDAGDADDLVGMDGEADAGHAASRLGRARRHRAAPGRGRPAAARRAAAG